MRGISSICVIFASIHSPLVCLVTLARDCSFCQAVAVGPIGYVHAIRAPHNTRETVANAAAASLYCICSPAAVAARTDLQAARPDSSNNVITRHRNLSCSKHGGAGSTAQQLIHL